MSKYSHNVGRQKQQWTRQTIMSTRYIGLPEEIQHSLITTGSPRWRPGYLEVTLRERLSNLHSWRPQIKLQRTFTQEDILPPTLLPADPAVVPLIDSICGYASEFGFRSHLRRLHSQVQKYNGVVDIEQMRRNECTDPQYGGDTWWTSLLSCGKIAMPFEDHWQNSLN